MEKMIGKVYTRKDKKCIAKFTGYTVKEIEAEAELKGYNLQTKYYISIKENY